jgi:predicted DNA-binding antitoxin AbrB/MazE fold protein
METIIAIYEQGLLRPLIPLQLPEHARVRVQVVEQLDSAADTLPSDQPYSAEEIKQNPLLAFANLGSSGETSISEHIKDVLANEIRPITGWSTSGKDDEHSHR